MFVKTIGPPTASIMLVGEAPGEEEDRAGKPFVSTAPAGRTLDILLSQAGLSRHECLIANVAREKPPGNKIEFFFEDAKMTTPKPILREWINLLKTEIEIYKPNIVVGLGSTALFALCGLKGINSYRGYVMESSLVKGQKVLCTFHPQKVNYEWKQAFTVVMDLRKAVANSYHPIIEKDKRVLRAYPSRREAIDYLKFLINDHKEPVSCDIETTARGCHIDIIGFADSPESAMSIQLICNSTPKYSIEDELEIWTLVAEVLHRRESIFHNGAFDITVLWHQLGILAERFKYDTLLALHACWPETPRSLAYAASICLNVPPWKHESSTLPTLYNAADAANTYGIWQYMEKVLTSTENWDTFNFEVSQVFPSSMLQIQGIYVDKDRMDQLRENIRIRKSVLEGELKGELGRDINFASPKQLQEVLYQDLNLPVQYKRRTSINDARKVTTDATALKKLRQKTDNPILDKIMELKKLNKLLTSFIDIELSPESRVHTSYNITGATMSRQTSKGVVVDDEESYKSFGRWSSSASIIFPFGSGNLQNIPKEARVLYTAPPNHLFLQADYMQAEAVVVAYLTNDIPLKNLFKESFGLPRGEREARHLDVHKLTASRNFNIPIEEVTKEMRKIGKMLRHATNYSAGPAVLANSLGCSVNDAKALLQQHHNTSPQLRIWHQNLQKQLRETRTLTNLFGRKHRFLERWDDDLFRSAYSFIPQSTVGDLLNRALVKLYETHGEWLTIYLQLHDAIYCIVHEEEIEKAATAMRECMLIQLEHGGEEFTIDVDFSIGKSWGEIEEI